MRQRFFFTKTAVTRKRKVKKPTPRCKMNCFSEGYKQAIDKIWGRIAKNGFLGQKPCFSRDRAKSCKEKSTLFPNKYQCFSKFWVISDFWPKKRLSAKRKNSRFSVFPAGTRSVVIVDHFLMARTVPLSLVDDGPKLGVLVTKWEWPERAKNRGEPRKCPIARKQNFFSGWSEWES